MTGPDRGRRRAAGCDVAILQASEMGRPIYERLGFRTVVEYDGCSPAEPEVRRASRTYAPASAPRRSVSRRFSR